LSQVSRIVVSIIVINGCTAIKIEIIQVLNIMLVESFLFNPYGVFVVNFFSKIFSV
jgi:hypothetical protein